MNNRKEIIYNFEIFKKKTNFYFSFGFNIEKF